MINQILLEKLNMLSAAFNALLGRPDHSEELFKATEYSSFISFYGDLLKAIDPNSPISRPFDDPTNITPEQAAELEASKQMALKAMQRVDYEPPSDPDDKLIHLKAMWEIYRSSLPYPPTIKDLFFDLSFTKLIADVHREIAVKITQAERDLTRTKKIAASKGKSRDEAKTPVYEAFYKLNFNKGTKLNRVVTDIFHELGKILISPPSVLTIRRYLKDDPEIMRLFKKDGRFMIYQT